MILKYEFSGKDIKNNVNACTAWSILLPSIDPDLSSTKTYSPRY